VICRTIATILYLTKKVSITIVENGAIAAIKYQQREKK
jgi:hypothetical protein